MENAKVPKGRGAGVAIIVAVVGVAAASLSLTASAAGQQSQPCSPAVVIQWQPQSILETLLMARITEDNKAILNGLQALAKNSGLTETDMMGYVGNTYLRTPSLYTKAGWVEGWDKVLPLLKSLVARDSRPVINSVSAVIEYLPLAEGVRLPEKDIDARAPRSTSPSPSPMKSCSRRSVAPSRSAPGAGRPRPAPRRSRARFRA